MGMQLKKLYLILHELGLHVDGWTNLTHLVQDTGISFVTIRGVLNKLKDVGVVKTLYTGRDIRIRLVDPNVCFDIETLGRLCDD